MKPPSATYRTWGQSRGRRLPHYPAGYPVHVVISSYRRVPVFGQESLATHVFSLVVEHPASIAACLMPDHLHWLLTTRGDFVADVTAFKSFSTQLSWGLGWAGSLWQKSFRDRVIRRSDDIQEVIAYILQNPDRAGLVEVAEKYPYRFLRKTSL